MEQVDKTYSVWVGGWELNDHYLDWNEAFKLAQRYEDEGYDDVKIRQEI